MQPQNNSSTVQNRWKQAGGISSAYLSLITCLDNQLERARHRHKLLHWVTQSAYVCTPYILFHSPSSPFSTEGFLGAQRGRPSAPSLPADAQPSCCSQGTRKDCIFRRSAGKTAAGHAGRITAGRSTEIWAQKNRSNQPVSCYTANNPASSPVLSVWGNFRKSQRSL